MSMPAHPSISRRRFLQTTAAASTVFASPYFIPSRAFGANERVNLGFIGCKNRGMQNMEGFGIVGKDVGTVGLAALAGGWEGGYVGLLARAPFRQSVAIGHGAGAAIGLAVVLLTRGPEAEVSAGTTLDVVFDQPLTLDADYLPANGPGTPPAPFPRPARPEEKNKIHHRRPPLFPFLWPRV